MMNWLTMVVYSFHGVLSLILRGEVPTKTRLDKWMNLNVWEIAGYGVIIGKVVDFICIPWDRWKYRKEYRFNWKKELGIDEKE